MYDNRSTPDAIDASHTPTPSPITSWRLSALQQGYRPVPVIAPEIGNKDTGKSALLTGWRAACIDTATAPDEVRNWAITRPCDTNTGIITAGLRAVDIDLDDPAIVNAVRNWITERCGTAPMRYRSNSARCLLLYRAADGTPAKDYLAGTAGKIEVLGDGQQFVAAGGHYTGAVLE